MGITSQEMIPHKTDISKPQLFPEVSIAPFVLKYLRGLEEANKLINRNNFTILNSPEARDYAGEHKDELSKRLIEAWSWLERELFIASLPAGSEAYFITRRGQRILEEQDFASYKKGQLLPSENLDPVLVRKVKPMFIRGDYDAAVFQAFKEVEVRVRKKTEEAGYDTNKIGVPLMREAFKKGSGPLTNRSLEEGEQEAICHLFAGAIGSFKNPSSHRDVEYSDPNEVADIIHIANQLLRMCESAKDNT